MMWRAWVLAGGLALGCTTEGGGSTSAASTGSSSTGGETSSGSSAEASDSTGATGVFDMCPSRPSGDWNACRDGAALDNSLCEWTESPGKSGTVSCLSPAGGDHNVCGIEACVEDCDCFAPPATGTAVVTCAPILGDGGKACVLYCAGGQICPDGMECFSGYCYWPNG